MNKLTQRRMCLGHRDRNARLPPHRLQLPIRQTPPQPFKGTKLEVLQPNRADNQLENPDGQHNKIDLVKLKFAIVIQPITEEKQGADHRVRDVIGQGHSPYRHQAAEQVFGKARLEHQNQRRCVRHDDEDALERINQRDPIDGNLLHAGEVGFQRGEMMEVVIIGVKHQR